MCPGGQHDILGQAALVETLIIVVHDQDDGRFGAGEVARKGSARRQGSQGGDIADRDEVPRLGVLR